MGLKEEFTRQGQWLFRWRSYLPLIIFPILIFAISNNPENLEHIVGDTLEDVYEVFAILISFLGLGIRCFTVGYAPRGTSGRDTKKQKAKVLNTTGMYSITRNPLYLGNFCIILGIAMFTQCFWAVCIVILSFWLYYERIIFAKEQFLRAKFGKEFEEWANKTPAFLPKLSNYKHPDVPFSLRKVLKREYSGFFCYCLFFFFIRRC